MKKILLFSIVFVLVHLNSFAQWTALTSGTTSKLNAVNFLNVDTGYAVGDSGTIIKTINGGTNWITLSSSTTGQLSAVCFTNADVGYVVGTSYSGLIYSGFILKTINGGTTWTTQLNTAAPSGLTSVFFSDANTGHVAGWAEGPGPQFNTSNGGISWIASSPLIYSVLQSIYFTSSDTGYAVGSDGGGGDPGHSKGIILKTTDGGASWADIPNISASYLSSVYFTDANTGFAVGDNYSIAGPNGGAIIRTSDGGTTWHTVASGTANLLQSLTFTGMNNGYVVGEFGTILKTTDEGSTWTSQTSGTIMGLNSVSFIDSNTGYAVGEGGTILKTTNGGGPTGIREKAFGVSLTIYPNPAVEKVTIKTSLMGNQIAGTICVYGMTGQELIRRQVEGSEADINVSSLPTGIYIIRMVTNEKFEFGKFVKE